MKIVSIKSLIFPEVKVIKFERYKDFRGYFTESYRKSELFNNPNIDFFKNFEFLQSNESFSKRKALRGLHFQWNPYVGKLVRTLYGHIIDLFLDIRLGSPTFGKIAAYDMPNSQIESFGEWIWIPPGFAHGCLSLEKTLLEYFCTGEYNPKCEASISPLSEDLDWSLCDYKLKKIYHKFAFKTKLITHKDKIGFSIEDWKKDKRSDNFIYGQKIT